MITEATITEATSRARDILFISKATPGDDEFVLWLAPRLEAAGYTVFADILSLEAGDRWRKQVTGTLQSKAVKMLLCCRDSSLEKDGVQEEIGIALDVSKELNDPRFIIPLRLERFRKLFGIGELQYVDFVGRWASGLHDLLETLETQRVPRLATNIIINPSWESYKNRLAIKIEGSPEVLTTNWLRIANVPDIIRYYTPSGAIDHGLMERACGQGAPAAAVHFHGFFSFAKPDEIESEFASVGKFTVQSEHSFFEFLEQGSESRNIRAREAQNLVSAMLRGSWEKLCRTRGLYEYNYAELPGFHVTESQVPLGKRIPWGPREQRRSAMLCNSAGGRVWQFGASAMPHFWPFPHFRIKSRVLFAELAGKKVGAVFHDSDLQHRLRRSVCKGWRNKAWHGRVMAFLELLSGDSSYIVLPLSQSEVLRLDATPVRVIAPVTTALPDAMPEDAEEQDPSTIGDINLEDGE